jgi:hypothetical protein
MIEVYIYNIGLLRGSSNYDSTARYDSALRERGEMQNIDPARMELPMLRYTKEDLENLAPNKRHEYARLLIHSILEKNKQGMTPADVVKATGLDEKTVRNHLEFLSAVREAYKREYSTRLTVYFPNGRLLHPYRDVATSLGESQYSFKEIENSFGEWIYVQEKKKDMISSAVRLVGGIMIPKEHAMEFLEALRKFIEEDAALTCTTTIENST